MKTISKKEIRATIEDSLTLVIAKFYSARPSKNTKKYIQTTARKLAAHIKDDVKKHLKDISKITKSAKNRVSRKKSKKTTDKPVAG